MSNYFKKEKIEHLILKTIADDLSGVFENSLITVKDVSLSNNFEEAKVLISVFPENRELIYKIKRKEKYFRGILAKKLNLKYTPKLEFLFEGID